MYACLFLLLTGVLTACGAKTSGLQINEGRQPAVNVTLTPFQPQFAGGNNDLQVIAPLAGPTYTPYPTSRASSDGLPNGLEIIPGAQASSLVVYNPLTGLPVNDPKLLERRPMVIKVANAPDYIRPQSGLTLADQVYEYYIEWGDTRFIAVMYGNDSPFVGPVRSGRYFDEHVARMYNAFLVFKFADPREFDYLKKSTLNEFLVVPGNSACPPFVIGPQTRDTYNNIFFNTARWAACAASKGVDNSIQPLRRGFFAEGFPDSDLVATRIFTQFSIYSYNYWDYDPVTHKYFRYQEANDMVNGQPESYAPLSDAQTGMPVTADNVAVIFVPYTFASQFDADDEVYHIDLIDSGNAYVFRDGLAIPAVWNRLEENQPILLTTLDGDPIYMHPGRTFYEVIGTSSVHTREGTEWKFRFSTP